MTAPAEPLAGSRVRSDPEPDQRPGVYVSPVDELSGQIHALLLDYFGHAVATMPADMLDQLERRIDELSRLAAPGRRARGPPP